MPHYLNAVRGCCVALTVFVLLSSSTLPGAEKLAKPEEVGLSSERLKRIGEMVQRHMQAGDFSGAVTLVARRGRVAHLESFGRLDKDRNITTTVDASFRIASMSKAISGPMQGRAILEAAAEVLRDDIDVRPEVMVPLVADVEELTRQKHLISRVAC